MKLLSIIWYIASILILYLAICLTKKYKFKQLNLREIIISLKSKSKNNITPLASLCVSLAAKIGVGSLSGVALAIYYGGVGTIFWIMIISLFVAINTYYECILGIKYRDTVNGMFVGGPSYYIKKCLGNKYLGFVYSVLLIITYSILFLAIQTNTIISVTSYLSINNRVVIILLVVLAIFIVLTGIKGVVKSNIIIVPLMLIIYLGLGLYIFIDNYWLIPRIIMNVIYEALKIKSIIPVFLIGMQRAIFISESSLGTSAIAAGSCDNTPNYQGLIEVVGIYITIFVVCLTTFFIIVTSDYNLISYEYLNGIEIVIYAFKYHFGYLGEIFLSIITIIFALSTIIASYFLGENNIFIISKKKILKIGFKIIFVLVVLFSSCLSARIIWNITDYFVAILAIINVYSMLKIYLKDN